MVVLEWFLVALSLFGQAATAGEAPAKPKPKPDPDPARFAEAIEAFARQDEAKAPEPGGVVFVGSSSIRLWNLEESFPGIPALNRGFGGSQTSDAIHYVDQVVRPYRPKLVVMYEGDNDIAAGKAPEQVVEDFRRFVHLVRDKRPETTIAFLSIKPSTARWALWDTIQEVNLEIARLCAADDRLIYVDVGSPLLGPDGKPRPELYNKDGLHLNNRGYRVWTERLLPILEAQGFTPAQDRAGL